jgi:hypothetical protein
MSYVVFALLLTAASMSSADSNAPAQGAIRVSDFTIGAGLDVPAGYVQKLTADLLRELQRAKIPTITGGDEKPAGALRLTGEITEFHKGNRAMRYMVPGIGKTKIVALYHLADETGGGVVTEGRADGTVVMGGLLKGASDGATSGLAKEIVKKIKKKVARR